MTPAKSLTYSIITQLLAAQTAWTAPTAQSCDSVDVGYQCQPQISHHWGQYSPYFAVHTDIPSAIPAGCNITFAQILSRHGARDPTASKTAQYNQTIRALQKNVSSSAFTGKYAFLKTYEYTLGADQLTLFGENEMINSGIKFFDRYQSLARSNIPFVRSSSEARVVESAQNWTQGFHAERVAVTSDTYPYPILVISEADGSNNTLNHDLCTNFESDNDFYSQIAGDAQSTWASVFAAPIAKRLTTDLPGAKLSKSDVIALMDLCPFNTVADPSGTVSPFCALFTEAEWRSYGYYETLNKFYGYGPGNPLGPTQGVGFAAELLARLTGDRSYVTSKTSYTSINHTLDSSSTTFPLDRVLYADFSHDNDMTAIFSALGLYNHTGMLSNVTINAANSSVADGYSAAWTVPFAARAYIEKMVCSSAPNTGGWQNWQQGSQELVRIIINDRVVPLVGCNADSLGRCTLDAFVKSQTFVTSGGLWKQCFT